MGVAVQKCGHDSVLTLLNLDTNSPFNATLHKHHYYADASVLLEINQQHISIFSLVKISMTSFTAFCIEYI